MKSYITLLLITISLSSLSQSGFSQNKEETTVLILGTPHLGNMPEGFESSHLNSLLVHLEKQQFDLIAVENMPAERINEINGRQLPYWKEELNDFVGKRIENGQRFQQLFNLSYEGAYELKNSAIKKSKLTDEDRLSLLKASLCLYDNWSALLQFNLIKNKQGLPAEVSEHLAKYGNANNEINLIAVKIAQKMHHTSLYPIDDWDDEARLFLHKPAFFEEYPKIEGLQEKVFNHPAFRKAMEMEEQAITDKDLFKLYAYLNSDEYMKGDFDAQWKVWFETNLPSQGDLARYYLWEMRNLRITANIAELIALHPGKKILVIIGASHKSFVQKYLGQMPNVELLKF